MTNINDINFISLLIGALSLIIPITIFLYYKIPLIKDTIISSSRMVIQLLLIAVYLEWIFKLNNKWINLLWVIIMILVAVFTSINRIEINRKQFIIPLFLSFFSSLLITDTFFLGLVIKPIFIFDARYLIPITGMIIGNSMNHNIIGLSAYLKSLSEKSELYYFLLTNTNNMRLTLNPFIKDAVKQSINPFIASMSVIGLISLPGMMTGQILGGNSPATAIKYQIIIMFGIFLNCNLTLFFSIFFINSQIFDKYKRVKNNIMKNS